MRLPVFFPLLVVLKVLLGAFLIVYSGVGLGPDEAQYWTWSRKLDWGYYSKPPGIAWQIFLSTFIFGSTEFGVRAGALIVGTLLVIATYLLARRAGASLEVAFISALTLALTPVGVFSAYFSTTDGGMILFWTLALGELARAIANRSEPSYIMLGIYVALGALFKWPIYWIWAIVVVLFFIYPHFRNKKIVLSLGISLLALAPSVWWNWSHEFATMRHVFSTVVGASEGAGAFPNPLEFIGAQIALFTPIFFVLFCFSARFLFKSSDSMRFLGSVSLSLLCFGLLYSCFKKAQGNWFISAYPPAFVFLSEVSISFIRCRRWIFLGTGLSLLLIIGIFAIPNLQEKNWLASIQVPWKFNPFRHNVGWQHLEKHLDNLKANDRSLIADKYQTVSILSFYGPHQKQAQFFNIMGFRKNQFSYWDMPKPGENCLFVAVENGTDLENKLTALGKFYENALASYFSSVRVVKIGTLFEAYNQPVKGAIFVFCDDFLGRLPEDSEKF